MGLYAAAKGAPRTAAGIFWWVLDQLARAASVALPRTDEPAAGAAPEPIPEPDAPPPTLFPGNTIPERYLLAGTTPECAPAHILLTLPDPGAAAALSGFVGFGAGNFYAKRPGPGVFAAFTQVLGLSLLRLNAIPNTELSIDGRTAWVVAGGSMAALGRMADVGLAVSSAHITRQQPLDHCGL